MQPALIAALYARACPNASSHIEATVPAHQSSLLAQTSAGGQGRLCS
jgi:hypothetical protein